MNDDGAVRLVEEMAALSRRERDEFARHVRGLRHVLVGVVDAITRARAALDNANASGLAVRCEAP